MDYDATDIPVFYDRGRDHGPEVLDLWMNVVSSSVGNQEKIKNWAIVIWAAATGSTITTPNLNRYIAFTAAIPLAFLFVDAWYRRIQRRFIWRTNQISAFLNDERLAESFNKQEIIGFTIFDPASRNSRGQADHESFISIRRVLGFGSVSLFYVFLIIMSLLAWFVRPAS
jgi:hypothetical protein